MASKTHSQTIWPSPPPVSLCEAAVGTLARLHAHWWNDGQSEWPETSSRLQSNEESLARYFQPLVPSFLDDLDKCLSAYQREVIQRVCCRIPELKTHRATLASPVTRTHGDPHFWNILYPHDTSLHGCVFIDWEDWRIDMAAADLASMLALHWDRERRLQHERRLLRHYLDTLRTETHTAYDWTALNDDYHSGTYKTSLSQYFSTTSQRLRQSGVNYCKTGCSPLKT